MGQTTQKFRVDTDKGSYEIEVEMPAAPMESSYALMSKAAETNKQPEGGPHEPDTFTGGFLKSIKDQLTPALSAQNPGLEAAAHPKGVADLLTLILPSGINEAINPIRNVASGMARGFSEGKGSILKRAAGALKEGWGIEGRDTGGKLYIPGREDIRSRRFNARPLSDQMKYLPTEDIALPPSRAAAPPTIGETPSGNDLPLYLQQQLMEQHGGVESAASGSSRVGMPPHNPTQAPITARLAPQKKAPSLDDVLMEALQDEPIDARISNLPPEQTITPGGSTKQSGKFRKSDSLGQPGGYTSGRPATGPDRASELLDKFGGRAAPESPLGTETAPVSEGAAGAPPAENLLSGEPIPASRVGELTEEDWKMLRQHFGARDAGRLTGKSAEDVRKLSGGGPSRTPTVAQERIDNYNPDKHLK